MRLNFRTKYPFAPKRETHFVEKIMDGRKKHTLREDPKKRWKSGMIIQMATGSRYKPLVFNEVKLVSVQEVEMELLYDLYKHDLKIKIDGYQLMPEQIDDFIENDGFENINDFVHWFFNGVTMVNFLSKVNLRLLNWDDEHVKKTDYLLPF